MKMKSSVQMAVPAKLALDGGQPVREDFLPLTRPWIGEEEKREVMDTLNGVWLSRGPKVSRFEEDFANYTGANHAIAVSSCTAALHVSLVAAGVKQGDEVMTSPVTFPATTNAVLYERARPVLVDVDRRTFNIDTDLIEARITPRTKAIITVHMAGQPCDMDEILAIAKRHNLIVIEDAAHAVGAKYGDRHAGAIGDFGCFSFYASKNLVTGDGGMITVENDEFASFARVVSLHGMSATAWKRYSKDGGSHWDLVYPGFKYNMTDIEASLGIHQLRKIEEITSRRRRWAARYDELLADIPEITLPYRAPSRRHAAHLYIITLDVDRLNVSRDNLMEILKAENIGCGIHFVPVHLQPYYRQRFGYKPEDFPNAAWLSSRILSLPLFPQMTEIDVEDVARAVHKAIACARR
jgi:dTDP-4-amino-4,6-dideoxygalactose transaminase